MAWKKSIQGLSHKARNIKACPSPSHCPPSLPPSFLDSTHLREAFSSHIHMETKSPSTQEGTIYPSRKVHLSADGGTMTSRGHWVFCYLLFIYCHCSPQHLETTESGRMGWGRIPGDITAKLGARAVPWLVHKTQRSLEGHPKSMFLIYFYCLYPTAREHEVPLQLPAAWLQAGTQEGNSGQPETPTGYYLWFTFVPTLPL